VNDDRALLNEALRALRHERGQAWNAARDATEAEAVTVDPRLWRG